MVIRVVGLIITILVLIPVLTGIERWALQSLWRFGTLASYWEAPCRPREEKVARKSRFSLKIARRQL